MENKLELDKNKITDVMELANALKNKSGIAGEVPWTYLASLLFGMSSKKSIAQVVEIINKMENK